MCFELELTLGVYCILLLYIILIHYYYILYYLILSSSLPFPIYLLYLLPSPIHLFPSLTILFCSLLFSSFPYNPLLILSPHIPLHSQYSFYTCRYLHILIYILQIYSSFPIFQYRFPKYLTPHVLSEWMVEV